MENNTVESNLFQAVPETAVIEEPQPEAVDNSKSAWEVGLEQRISARAYELYLERGGNGGDPLSDWLQAEAEICGSSQGVDETEGLIAVDGESQESYGASVGGL